MNNLNVLRMLEEFQQVQNRLDPMLFVLALFASLAASYIAAGLYRVFYESRGTGSQVHRSFPLLGISITTLFIGVQLSIPLSLGLLGALSIIRFRTPIKEPEEIGFIMLVIAASISAATFNFRFLVILYAVAIGSLFLTRSARQWKLLKRSGLLIITLPDEAAADAMKKLEELFHVHLGKSRMESSSSRDGVTSIQMAFSGLKTDAISLQGELRAAAPVSSVHIYLDRSGGNR